MGKKKTQSLFDDATTKGIIKKYGEVVRSGTDVFEETKNLQIIPVSPAIDLALGGGIQEGSWVLLTGDPKSGKTTTALQFASNCQKEEYGERPVIYLNAEGRLKSMNLSGIDGLKIEDIKIIESNEEPMSAEEYLDIAEAYIKQFPKCVLIVDSTSTLTPERELTASLSGQFRAGLPKILAAFTRRMSGVVRKQRAIIILITHFISNTSGMGYKTKLPDGGVKIQYQADTRMEVKYFKSWEADDEPVGQMVVWKVFCSSVGPPGKEAESWIRYGKGVGKTKELIHMGCELGLIGKAGAWYSCDFLLGRKDLLPDGMEESQKFQGQEKLYSFIEENSPVLSLLEEELKAML